jgi:hypothetical protein
MEEYSFTSTHPLGHTGPVMGLLYLLFTSFHFVPCKKQFLLHFPPVNGNKTFPITGCTLSLIMSYEVGIIVF